MGLIKTPITVVPAPVGVDVKDPIVPARAPLPINTHTVGVPVDAAPTLPGQPASEDAHGEAPHPTGLKEASAPKLGHVPKPAPPGPDPYLEVVQARIAASSLNDRVTLVPRRRVTVVEAPAGSPGYVVAMLAAGLDPELKDTIREVYLPRLLRILRHSSVKEPHPFLPSECWLWANATDAFGWPKAKLRGQVIRPSRAWLGLSSIPASIELERGRFVATACDRRACVQPAHFMEVSATDFEAWLLRVGEGHANPRLVVTRGPEASVLDAAMKEVKATLGDKAEKRALAVALIRQGVLRTSDIAAETGYSQGRISQMKKALKEGKQ